MFKKILIPLHENDVAPRFDLATEVMVVTDDSKSPAKIKRIIVLPQASAEQLCRLIINEGIQVVICSGIEDDYYQYLNWKGIAVVDSVVGPSETALVRYFNGTLKPGNILYEKTDVQ